MIYSQDQPSTSIYLVIDGKVKVSRMADDGHQVVVDIYQTDEFFGESALLGLPQRAEQATALENTKLMTWTTRRDRGYRHEAAQAGRGAVADPGTAYHRVRTSHRELFGGQYCPPAGALADPFLASGWGSPKTMVRCAWCRSRTSCFRNTWARRARS